MDPTARKIRQLLDIDRLFGIDRVPLGRMPDPPVVQPAAEPDHRSGPARTSDDVTTPRPSGQARTYARPPAAPLPGAGPLIPTMQEVALIPTSTLSRKEKIAALEQLREEIAAFVDTGWPHGGWNNLVFGEGDPDADLMFIGEAPGADEDRLGRPFVGRAGQLLDKQIVAMGLAREQVYIANIGKVRPPGNRVPTPEEADRMMPYLVRQIEIISPRVIVSLGATSAKYLLNNPKLAITRERGQWKDFHGIDLMPTFHPAYLLRAYTKENRARVWDDLQSVMQRLGIKK